MRRLISILLLAMFVLPALAPFFSLQASGESRLPACCRKAGRHQCELTAAQRALLEGRSDDSPEATAPVERCPYAPSTAPQAHGPTFGFGSAQGVFAELASHPTGVVQTESRRRISEDRTRQKRGPPSTLLS